MNYFSKFSNEERDLLISVPYRAGLWISACDENEHSTFDDRQETLALEESIQRMADLHRKMPFAAVIMKDIKAQKARWRNWQSRIEEAIVLEDTQKALILCSEKAPKGALAQYKHAIWQICLMVAYAHGEHHDPDNEMHADRFFASLVSYLSPPKLTKAPENISAKEKTALKKLRAVLKG